MNKALLGDMLLGQLVDMLLGQLRDMIMGQLLDMLQGKQLGQLGMVQLDRKLPDMDLEGRLELVEHRGLLQDKELDLG